MSEPKDCRSVTGSRSRESGVAARNEMPAADGVRCRRVDASLPPEEHATCPYCFGRVSDVATADHARFCDFHPGEDPICFGFPTDCGCPQP